MRDLFPGWYAPNESELRDLWDKAWVVIDSSVLLNLYKYPEGARKDFFVALNKVADRIWLPYQAAMEYQQNRLNVIADQVKKFAAAREAADKSRENLAAELGKLQLAKRHSTINPKPLVDGVNELVDKFIAELHELERKQPRVNSHDEIREKLDTILKGRVGPPPKSQESLEMLNNEAQKRFDNGVPPGFKDADSKGDSSHHCNGLQYTRKFGDYILWSQVLDFVGTNENQSVIFITDDEKADWWHIVESQGKVRLGPATLLSEEFAAKAPGAKLLMHTSESFLYEAKERLGLDVSQDSIDQVRDIAEADHEHISMGTAEWTFFYWLRSRHGGAWVDKRQFFPDFIVDDPSGKIGYDLKFLRRPEQFHIFPILQTSIRQAEQFRQAGNVNRFVLAILVTSESAARQVRLGYERSLQRLSVGFPIEVYLIYQDFGEQYPNVNLLETLNADQLPFCGDENLDAN